MMGCFVRHADSKGGEGVFTTKEPWSLSAVLGCNPMVKVLGASLRE